MFNAVIRVGTFAESKDDLFKDLLTTHGFEQPKGSPVNSGEAWNKELSAVQGRLCSLARHLKEEGFVVWLYAVQEILVDSRVQDDPLRLL